MINKIIYELSEYTEKNQIISDVGSVKNILKKKLSNLMIKKFSLVPGHPIAGTNVLVPKMLLTVSLQDKWCILTPISNNKESIRNY